MAKFLDTTGVLKLWAKIKALVGPAGNLVSGIPGIWRPWPDDNDVSSSTVTLAFKHYNVNANGQVTDSGYNDEMTVNAATTSKAGVMTASDKSKLDSITADDIKNIHDITAKIKEGYNLVAIKS